MMTTLTNMRRPIVAVLMLVTFLMTGAGSAGAGARASAAGPIARKVCDYDWQRSTYQLKRLIRCAARRWEVIGGPDKAVSVARCESRLDPDAYNPGGYAGVFQQAMRYWPPRASTYGFRDYSVYNGRANVVVSVRMAHRGGWGDWACG